MPRTDSPRGHRRSALYPEIVRRTRPPVIILAVLLAAIGGAQGWIVMARHGEGQRHDDAVPWVNRPAPPRPAPRFAPPISSAPCRAEALRGSVVHVTGVTGNFLGRLALTNMGTAACSVDGTPRLFGVRSGAPRQAIGLGDGRGTALDGRGGRPFRQTDLLPGGQATITLDIPYSFFLEPGQPCARDNPHRPMPFDSLVIGLAAGGTVDVPGTLPDLECAAVPALLLTTGFVVNGSDDPLPEPVDRLQARIDAPRSAKGGTTLSFSVVLHNPTDGAIALDPCPGYWVHLSAFGGSDVHAQLNCDTVHRIDPGQSVRFAMRIRVPAGAHLGSIYWNFDTPAGLNTPAEHNAMASIEVLT